MNSISRADSEERSFFELIPFSTITTRIPFLTADAVKLESECGDLTLVALEWDINNQGCPYQGAYVTGCEWSNSTNNSDEEIIIYDYYPTSYLLIVDAKNPVDANFRLSVQCS